MLVDSKEMLMEVTDFSTKVVVMDNAGKRGLAQGIHTNILVIKEDDADRGSTMQWSPVKLAGQKKALKT